LKHEYRLKAVPRSRFSRWLILTEPFADFQRLFKGGGVSRRVCYDKSMSNRILRVQVREHLLDPAQAELWITASAEHVTPDTELRGRLAGPSCLYASTVEVGYPLRPFPRRPEGLEGLAARVVIPEPSLWEPQCPFVYQGTVELWQDGERRDQLQIQRGLRHLALGRTGLRMNGRPLVLHGRSLSECSEKQIAALRRAGCNLLLAATTDCLSQLLPLADLHGFLVLGVLREAEQADLGRAGVLVNHPSFLGWLLKGQWEPTGIVRLRSTSHALVGIEIVEPPAGALLEGVDFMACRAGVAAQLSRGEETSPRPPLLLFGDGADLPQAFGRVQ
jgi:hypothetical protein